MCQAGLVNNGTKRQSHVADMLIMIIHGTCCDRLAFHLPPRISERSTATTTSGSCQRYTQLLLGHEDRPTQTLHGFPEIRMRHMILNSGRFFSPQRKSDHSNSSSHGSPTSSVHCDFLSPRFVHHSMWQCDNLTCVMKTEVTHPLAPGWYKNSTNTTPAKYVAVRTSGSQ